MYEFATSVSDISIVSARARQLNHRLKNRKNAIISRREAEATASDESITRNPASSGSPRGYGQQRLSASPTSGFVAVNQRPSNSDVKNDYDFYNGSASLPESLLSGRSSNGTLLHTASAATRAELLSKFFTNSERAAALDQGQSRLSTAGRPVSITKAKSKHGSDPNVDPGNLLQNAGSPVPIPHTPSNLLPFSKSLQQDRFDDSGPYKSDMMARMEQLNRGDRVQPPCDRCRRLHMDCLKNLTACMGCTKKHAKCSWKDVIEQELIDNPLVLRSSKEEVIDVGSGAERDRSRDPYRDLPTISHRNPPKKDFIREDDRGVRDEELLGEEGSGDEEEFDHERGRQAETITSPPAANTTTYHSVPDYPTPAIHEIEHSQALPSPPGELDNRASTVFASGSEHGSRPSTVPNGFQSVNVKGVAFGYDTHSRQDDEEMQRDTEQSDKERDALIQLSAAAQQVSESKQQQQQQSSASRENEREEK